VPHERKRSEWAERDREGVIERLREANEALIRKVREAGRATEALRRSEQHYRALFEAIDEGFCVVEVLFAADGKPTDYRFIEVNPAFEGQTGLRDAAGRRMRELRPDHEDHWFHIYGRVALTGEPRRFAAPARELDGRWFDVYAFPLGPPGPHRVGILFRDVTDRRAAEQALRELGERQSFLLELSDALRPLSDPVQIQASASRLVGTRLGASRVFYYEYDDDAGQGVIHRDFVRPDTRSIAGTIRLADFPKAHELVRRSGVAIADVQKAPELSDQDRASFARLVVSSYMAVPLVKQGRLVAVFGAHDSEPRQWTSHQLALMEETAERTWAAVEQARAEAALRETEARARAALNAVGMGSFLWYPQEDRGEPDARMLALFGLDRDEKLNLAEALARLIHPDDRKRYAQAVARATDPKGNGELQEEIRIIRPDGEERCVSITGQTAFAGDPPYAVRMPGVAIDLTERKRSEEAARKEQEERERRDREFVANAAHELRTPLAGILAAVDALDAGAKDHPENRERFLGHVRRGAARLARLSESLLLLARAGQQTGLPVDTVSVHPLLDQVAADLRVHAGVEVVVQAPPNLSVVTNAGLLERVLVNLAENSAIHTTTGRIELKAGATPPDVTFEVRDTGTGVDPETTKRAFDRFYRGSHEGDGFGLGLAIAKQAALAIGGELTVEPAGERGTLARLVLPTRHARITPAP
jgi:PAS domain S-box-containing protein